MNYFKRLFLSAALASTLFLPFAAVVEAAPAHTATGNGIYNANNLVRYASFSVNTTANATNCTTNWSVVGAFPITVNFTGTNYGHDVNVTNQTGNNYTGTAGYPSGGPYTINETVNGTVNGTAVTGHFDYGTGYTFDVNGTINTTDGSMSGNWTSNAAQTGTWTAPTGSAHVASTNCVGTGQFNYADVNGGAYIAKVTCAYISGNTTVFSGPVTLATDPSWKNKFLIAKAIDVAKPGTGKDQIFGSFVNSDPHCSTAGLVDGPFTVNPGEIVVTP